MGKDADAGTAIFQVITAGVRTAMITVRPCPDCASECVSSQFRTRSPGAEPRA
jgi:hypothetical protein